MKSIVLFVLGLFSGAVIVIGIQLHELSLPIRDTYHSMSGPVGGGFYKGATPDFSVQPISGNVYEYIDPEWTLVSSNKQQILFHSFEGKVLFVNLWATWCGPCIEEMPEIAELQAKLNSEDIVILLVSEEQLGIVDSFDNAHNLPLYASIGRLPMVFGGKGLPSTFIVDKKGKIRYKHAGPAEWGNPIVKAFLERLSREL